MVYCFVPQCSHDSRDVRCSMFRFPRDDKIVKQWEKLCRREDRSVNKDFDRICSCHFESGKKENGPSIFPWNVQMRFVNSSPEKKRKKSSNKKPLVLKSSEQSSLPRCLTRELDDHTYSRFCQSRHCHEVIEQLEEARISTEQKIKELEVQLSALIAKKPIMTLGSIKNDEKKMLLYTSLTSDVFDVLTSLLERFDLTYYSGWKVEGLSTADQLLMTLMKLKLNCRDLDLSERFGVSSTTVANIVKTFITALHEILVDGIVSDYIPSQLKCAGSMPKSFEEFVNARIVIDATEITVDIPRELDKQANCYSSYKGRHTIKFVTGVAPNSSVVFCSKAYPGSTSDVAIIEHCKVLDKLIPGDLVLADKGFTIHSLLPQGVSLNIPPFLKGKSQFTTREAKLCRQISRARIHVERANERIKKFQILSHISHSYRSFATQIFQLCTCLVNLQAPLLKEISKGYSANSATDILSNAD